jgi:adenylate cyclase
VLSLCVDVLQTAGHDVSGVDTGEKAVARLEEGWDLVIADLMLPGKLNGLDIVQRVGERADVIVMTAHPQLENSIQAIHAGVFDYLPKPFTIDKLLGTVRACAERGRINSGSVREGFLIERLQQASKEVEGLKSVEDAFNRFAGQQVTRLLRDKAEEPGHGRKMEVTVLFADVRWFTPFAASVGPEDAVAALNKRLTLVVEEVTREGGMVNKFMGDGALAIFGAPEPIDNAPARAARAALGIVRRTEELAAWCLEHGETPLRLGIGINTGEVVAGLLGTSQRMEYTVIGHAVNLASRLESISRPGQILVGKETVSRLGNGFKLVNLGIQDLAGIPGSVDVYQLLGDGH